MSSDVLVFDTGPLSHFAKAGWLGVLKAVVGARMALPDVVVDELTSGAAADTRLRTVLDAQWIERRELRSTEELNAFAQFSSLLVKGTRNRGEAGVLTLAYTLDAIAVIDDGAARKAAERRGIAVRPTLALVCEAIRSGLLTIALASSLADDLLASEYRLPFKPGDFERWAKDQGQLI